MGSGFEAAYEKSSKSEKREFLKGSGFLALLTSPKCKSLDPQTQLYCPKCSSQDLIKWDLSIHYECQTTGPIEEFKSNMKNGIIARSAKSLKRVGIEYGNPGIGFNLLAISQLHQPVSFV